MAVGVGIAMLLWPTGFFGPISSRVRDLFAKHTKTGNPLMDYVARHQAAKELNLAAKVAPYGFVMIAVGFCNDVSLFLLVYGVAAYFFRHKMIRLGRVRLELGCLGALNFRGQRRGCKHGGGHSRGSQEWQNQKGEEEKVLLRQKKPKRKYQKPRPQQLPPQSNPPSAPARPSRSPFASIGSPSATTSTSNPNRRGESGGRRFRWHDSN